jgi:hypothetical protein
MHTHEYAVLHTGTYTYAHMHVYTHTFYHVRSYCQGEREREHKVL